MGEADPAAYFAALEDNDGPEDLGGRRRWTDATEALTVTTRITWVVSEMLLGNISALCQYLDEPNEAGILIHGVEAYKVSYPPGARPVETSDSDEDSSSSPVPDKETETTTSNTALHLAACEAYPEIVKLLLEKGANPNARDLNGRTPLAEAALFGRLENVKLLLEHGANKELECTRKGQRLRAIDFARPLPANQDERYTRFGGEHAVHRESTYERDQDRKAIICLLQEYHPVWARDVSRDLSGFASSGWPNDENLQTLIAHFDVPGRFKTIGVLYRGSKLPAVAAMSGWGHYELDGANVQIAGKIWTEEVRRLCESVEHSLPVDPRDQGEPGRFYACHAEKQLVAYFVHKHLFLPYELVDDPGDDKKKKKKKELDDEYEDPFHGIEEEDRPNDIDEIRRAYDRVDSREVRDRKRQMTRLSRAQPVYTLKQATIVVSRRKCDDCEQFIEAVNARLGLQIGLFHRCLDPGCFECPR